jgi:hypothetical protein
VNPLIAAVLIVVPLLTACHPKPPEITGMSAVPAGPALRAIEDRQRAFSALQAVGSLEVITGGSRRAFDSVGVVVDGQRRFRIEAYGPLGQSIAAIVWNGTGVQMRAPGEDRIIGTGPEGLERLFGRGVSASELASLLSGNSSPTDLGAPAGAYCEPAAECIVDLRNGEALRRVQLSLPGAAGQLPRIRSVEQYQDGALRCRVVFDQIAEIAGYPLPLHITLENPKERVRVEIRYEEVEINGTIREDAFSLF